MIGERFGHYRLVERVGRGSMGDVFIGVHEQLGRQAAVKVLRPQLSRDHEIAQRFLAEARVVNLVRHPGLVDIYEVGRRPDGLLYILMEYLQGQALSARIRKRGAMGYITWPIFRQIAAAMTLVHSHGIVHRDLKPANVMLIPDPVLGERAKVLDFGIAKLEPRHWRTARAPWLVERNAIMGTPAYMAPEQFRACASVTDRADVYSLGIALFEAITGYLPFTARADVDLAALVKQHLMSPPPLHQLDASTPPSLVRLLSSMLDKCALNRPSMAEVVAEIDRHIYGETEQFPLISSITNSDVNNSVGRPLQQPLRNSVRGLSRGALPFACLGLLLFSPPILRSPVVPKLKHTEQAPLPMPSPLHSLNGSALPPSASPTAKASPRAQKLQPRKHPRLQRGLRASIQLAESAFEQEDWEGSAQHLQRAIAMAPRERGLRVRLAESLFRMGRHHDAARLCREVLKVEPANVEAQLTLRLAEEEENTP